MTSPTKTWKVLNLYAGIGGNRKNWENVDVTAVEKDAQIAAIYKDHFSQDHVVRADAHEYLRENFHKFDFVWSSPPCPTHSHIRNIANVGNGQSKPVYPDMKLYEEIIFLQQAKKSNWQGWDGHFVVENVKSYYDPLIRPQTAHRHYLWSDFTIPSIEIGVEHPHNLMHERKELYGFDLSGYDLNNKKKTKLLRNCVHPDLGGAVLQAAKSGGKQKRLNEI